MQHDGGAAARNHFPPTFDCFDSDFGVFWPTVTLAPGWSPPKQLQKRVDIGTPKDLQWRPEIAQSIKRCGESIPGTTLLCFASVFSQ